MHSNFLELVFFFSFFTPVDPNYLKNKSADSSLQLPAKEQRSVPPSALDLSGSEKNKTDARVSQMALPLAIGRGHHGTLGHHRGPTFSTADSSAHTLSQTSPVTSREFKLSSEDVGGVNSAECGSV